MKILVIFSMILLVIIMSGLTACTSITSSFGNKQWLLKLYNEQHVLEGTAITALFDNAEVNISRSAECNNYFASYESNGNELTVSAVAATEMYCVDPIGVMGPEQKYLTLLGDSATFKIEDRQLTIFTADSKTLMFSIIK